MKKQHLDPDEVLRVAYGAIVHEIELPVLSSLFNVNQGRVSEAVTAIEYTIHNHKEIYRLACQKKKTLAVVPSTPTPLEEIMATIVPPKV